MPLLTPVNVALIGFLLGPPALTLYNYFFKILENPDIFFDRTYWITMFASITLAFIAALPEAGMWIMLNPPSDGLTLFVIFLISLSQGFSINHAINKPVSLKLSQLSQAAEDERIAAALIYLSTKLNTKLIETDLKKIKSILLGEEEIP